MGRQRQENDVSRSTRRRHFTRSNQRAPKKNNSRAATLLVKVTEDREEPANEEANIQTDTTI